MRLVLLGDPVDHSRSPAIQNAALAACGIEGTYTARRVDAAGMASAVDQIRYGRLDGANVTMPHKELAFELSDRVSADALRAGAVNTLVRSMGEVWGHNTDVPAIREILAADGWPEDSPVLVLGTGGAAAGVVAAVPERDVIVSGRRSSAATGLLERTHVHGRVIPWGEAVDGAVVVNATPLGMHGESLPPAVVAAAGALLDLTYGPVGAPSVTVASERGIPVANGRDMLLAQAARAFEIWTGRAAPGTVMAEAF